jgi:transketolase
LLGLSRQALPILDRSVFTPAVGLQKGAYILADIGDGKPQIILMASGSEVALIVEAGFKLGAEGINVRLVSFPSWELFEAQPASYKDEVLPKDIPLRLAVEAGVGQGWEKWVGDHGKLICLEHYGASAPAKTLFEKFGFTAENVINKAMALLGDDDQDGPLIEELDEV